MAAAASGEEIGCVSAAHVPAPAAGRQGTERLSEALERAIGFLAAEQEPDGGFLNQVWHVAVPLPPQANVFPAALIAHSLSFGADGEQVRRKSLAFLEKERLPLGVWKHPASGEYTHFFFPPDVDDTSCAAAALRQAGHPIAQSEKMLLANRDGRGLFYTWFTGRPRWAGWDHFRLVLPQVRHVHLLVPLFTEAPCSIYNVDPVVNANALFCLGDGPATSSVAPWLVEILSRRTEGACDPWYPSPFSVRYFFARALAPWHEEAGALMRASLDAEEPRTPLETAFHLAARACWGMGADDELVSRLLAAQLPEGGWPAEPFYRGGDYWWGSAALSTAFAVEALTRHGAAPESEPC